jgi:hypothetical protein
MKLSTVTYLMALTSVSLVASAALAANVVVPTDPGPSVVRSHNFARRGPFPARGTRL